MRNLPNIITNLVLFLVFLFCRCLTPLMGIYMYFDERVTLLAAHQPLMHHSSEA
ncbi:hypothetical protein BDW62DRAFT_191985 [Aspergillus aurantiobrunneus]